MDAPLFAMEYSISVFKVQLFDKSRITHKNASCQNLCNLDRVKTYFSEIVLPYTIDITTIVIV